MYFSNLILNKHIVLLGFVFLLGCAAKPPVEDKEPQIESMRLQVEQEQARFQYALELIQVENVQKADLLNAKAIFDDLYERNSDYLGALINSADISYKLNNLEQAKSLYLQAKKDLSERVEQLNNIKVSENDDRVQTELKQEPESFKLFREHTYNQLGLIERQLGNFDKAEEYYRSALKIDSNNPVTLKNLAILLDLYRGQFVEALRLYEDYQQIVGDTDPKIKDWIFDLKIRLPVEEEQHE